MFLIMMGRLRPHLWGAGGVERLRTLQDLWGLLGAAIVAAAAGSVSAMAGVWVATGAHHWLLLTVTFTRSVSSIVVVLPLAVCLGHAVTCYRQQRGSLSGWASAIVAALARTPRRRLGEYVIVAVCTTTMYAVVSFPGRTLPLTYLLMAVAVWAGARLSTGYVAFSNLVQATVAMVLTMHGLGPFSTVQTLELRAMVGHGFVLVAAVVGLALALSRDEAAALSRSLRAEQAALAVERDRHARRARLMSAIVDSMADGLLVIDQRDRVLLHNPAARTLMGVQFEREARVDTASWGVADIDGTPITQEEVAHARALAGEQALERDVLVRNATVPEGRVLHVRATALHLNPAEVQAVLLFHDVTAERRQRDELATFAGVVAHDLLNPLTTIEGWSEACQDILAGLPDQPDVTQARSAVARVNNTAQRMRLLIQDLLAYTTARNSEITAEEVDLAALARDVAAARIDTATASNALVPRFDIGDLVPVLADRVLVRQLLDNLVSNAVKYTAPGTTPEVSVRTVREEGTVTVTLTDNGIGIPAGQHLAIFQRFHRAHATAGYSGTGLGLSICSRIVERHGGTIHVEDNPTGGSRFVFTLPATPTETLATPEQSRTPPAARSPNPQT
ncbi:sensor histidine kinase [Krasilnikovia cinnamomea]|uniref:sensor histidine kinase n=1 Tax=Krasilnikovia cinnamomea TaxID=349313 RepID=UPI0013EEEE52|nr:ATP-binding protein [Krasilnikovia cinnamomea]